MSANRAWKSVSESSMRVCRCHVPNEYPGCLRDALDVLDIHHDTSKTTKRMAQFSTRSWSIRKLSGKHVILAIVGLIVVYMLLRPQPRSTPSVQDVLEDNHQSVNPDVPAYSHPNPTLEIIPFHVWIQPYRIQHLGSAQHFL